MRSSTHSRDQRGQKVSEQPDGIQLVTEAVEALTKARAAVARAKAVEAEAQVRLKELLASGRCIEPSCTEHPPVPPVVDRYNPADDPNVQIHFRLAAALAEECRLDYQRTADRLWGPGLSFATAKNRISSHLARLRKLGIVQSLGGNRHVVDQAKFVEASGLTFPGEGRS